MDSSQARSLIRETFTQSFDKARFRHFTRNLLNHVDESKAQTWNKTYIKDAFKPRVNRFERLATYTDPVGQKIDILIIHLERESSLERARTSLRNFVADYLDQRGHKEAALVAFVSPDEADWRFSFVKMEYETVADDAGIITVSENLTPARRYSFLVGANEHSHTAQRQFMPLIEDGDDDPTLIKIATAFDIEKVTKEFFEQYKDLFDKVRDALNRILKRDSLVRGDFEKNGIEISDFAKNLLGQIVFLYFLQKKGWFGVDREAAWGTGNRSFIRYLFAHRAELGTRQDRRDRRPVNFFNDILEHLFYDALARDRRYDDHYYARFDCKVPFLNGGLFEATYKWGSTEILLPDELFSNNEKTKEGDMGTGILDVFDRFNFTINEAEPLEKDVAVDPEMLGKVFENLLDPDPRHATGTYYTPRVVVNYMCQQSLINYLAMNLTDGVVTEIETLVRAGYAHAEFQAAGTQKHEAKFLPDSIRRNARALDELLRNIAVCDPAVGSGAFLVGMMQEIVRARLALSSIKGMPVSTSYDLKRHAIENSLYGVDLDPPAVEIARLRLWLSLVVDEDDISQIQPLPNLDYKIMQGNSLLKEFKEVNLLDDDFIDKNTTHVDASLQSLKSLVGEMQAEAIEIRKLHGKSSAQAIKHEQKIDALLKQIGVVVTEPATKNQDLFVSDSRKRLDQLTQKYEEIVGETSRERKDKLRLEIDDLEWGFMKATLEEHKEEKALHELERHRRDNRRNYFLWQLHFANVFRSKGGFDIVIGNPPYLNVERVDTETKQAYGRRYKTFYKRYDVFGLFFELGLIQLVARGTVALIIPSQILNNLSYKKLRELMLSNEWLKEVFYIGDKVFESVNNDVCILFLQKPKVNKIRLVNALRFATPTAIEVETNYFDKFGRVISFLAGSDSDSIFDKIFNPDLPKLRESYDVFQGIVTGNNPLFLLSDDQIKDARIEKRLLHPVLLGRDFEKWRIRNPDRQIIYLDSKSDIQKFPNTEAWLKPHKKELMTRRECQRGVIPWYALQWARNKTQLDYTPKILIQRTRNPRLKTRVVAALDDAGFYGMESIIFIVPKKPSVPIKYLLAVLNSGLINYLYQTKFLNVAIKAEYLKDTAIPIASPTQQLEIIKLVDRILVAKRDNAQADTSKLEEQIDGLVYKLYELTDDEIAIVEDEV